MQTAFREGNLAEESTWQAVVLIPKMKGDYRGIGLVEVMWKVVAVILNCRFTSSMTFHDADSPLVYFPIGDEDYRLPCGLLRQIPLLKRRLH